MSLFKQITDQKQLESSNGGLTRMDLREYAPNRPATGTQFSSGRFQFDFTPQNTEWWIPARSYLRVRCKLTRINGTALRVQDAVAPNMGLCGSLFSSAEIQLAGKTIDRCDSNLNAIDQVEHRLHKSAGWMESVGATANFNQCRYDDRLNAVSGNGTITSSFDARGFTFFGIPGGKVIQSNHLDTPGGAADPNQPYITIGKITEADDGKRAAAIEASGGDVDLPMVTAINNFVKPGDYFVLENNGCRFQIANSIDLEPAQGESSAYIRIYSSMVGDSSNSRNNPAETLERRRAYFSKEDSEAARRVSEFEMMWSPLCLSIMKEDGAFPGGGKYSLIFNPHNDSELQKRVVETMDVKATDYKFTVEDIRYYACIVEGPRVVNQTYFMDLESTECHTTLLPSNSNALTTHNFTVSPTTNAVSIGFQSSLISTDQRFSDSKLKSGDGVELSLQRMFFKYAGQNYPSPDADADHNGAKDYTGQLYMTTMLNSSKYFANSQQETIEQWQQRGMLLHYQTPKDGQDRSTSLTLSTQFRVNTPNTNVLVFSHSRKVIRVQMVDGVVRNVEEMVL